jgi:hypothetical protein
MNTPSNITRIAFVGAITFSSAFGVANSASAAAVTNVASTITNTGTSSAENYSLVAQGGLNQVVNVPPAQSFSFGDSFNQAGNVSTSADFGATVGSLTGSPWNFQDNILFSTNGATVQSQAIAQLTGPTSVTDLQIRIISLTNNTPANAGHLVGNGSVTTIQSGWTNLQIPVLNTNITATLANFVNPGSYILQVRGEAAAGSSYSGTISFTPVPLPAALPLLLSGLGVFGSFARRNKQRA